MSLFRLIKITAQEEDAADADDGKIHCIIHYVAVTVLLFCCCCCSQHSRAKLKYSPSSVPCVKKKKVHCTKKKTYFYI